MKTSEALLFALIVICCAVALFVATGNIVAVM
jgi:hypothetical protein